tara:strand:+ start:749 stop:1393 length:645 start_codon:yes stop_codon:yes gene_type:complete
MTDNVCIPKNYFIILIFVFSFFTYIHSLKMLKSNNEEKNNNYEQRLRNLESNETESDNEVSENDYYEMDVKTGSNQADDIFIERDKKVINNILVAPERRLPRHAYPPKYFKDMINIPTRGYPDNYQQMGILVRKNDEKLLKLFGRQTYPGSSKYEYYVVDSYSNSDNKIPLNVNGDRELNDKEKIDIPWLDSTRGEFDVKIFDYNAPRYNPNII